MILQGSAKTDKFTPYLQSVANPCSSGRLTMPLHLITEERQQNHVSALLGQTILNALIWQVRRLPQHVDERIKMRYFGTSDLDMAHFQNIQDQGLLISQP